MKGQYSLSRLEHESSILYPIRTVQNDPYHFSATLMDHCELVFMLELSKFQLFIWSVMTAKCYINFSEENT